jgi:hypothetical protein
MKQILLFLVFLYSCANEIDNKIFSGQGCKVWMPLNLPGTGILCVDSSKYYMTYCVDAKRNTFVPFSSDFLTILDQGRWRIEQNYLYLKHDNIHLNEHRVHSKNIFADSIYLDYSEMYLINVTDLFEIKNCD